MRFLNQLGVSLIQGLVVSSVLAGSALIATRLVEDQKKAMKGSETRGQIEQLHAQIFATLQNREHCKATIAAAGIATASLNDANRSVSAIYNKTNTGTSAAIFEVNTGSSFDMAKIYMNGNVTINSMTFMVPKASDPAGQNVITYPSKLRILYSRLEGKSNTNLRTKDGYGAKRVSKISF